MSAIAGIVRFDGGAVDPNELDRMKRALAIHGPDRQNSWSDGEVGLAHCLFATTPRDAAERQPRLGDNLALVHCGRIDNRETLAEALGVTLTRTLPDSALIAAAFARWGDDFAAHLAGDFGIAAWQPSRRRLVLATDHACHRPLYYHWDGRIFRFASALKGLFAVDSVPREIDDDAMIDMLLRNDIARGKTLYRGIGSVPSAHILTLDANGLRTRQFWNPLDAPPIRFKRPDDYIDAFRELFDRVVSAQSASDHPVGMMMSGGLDSLAIASGAATDLAMRNERLFGFTLVPDPAAPMPKPDRLAYHSERERVEAFAARYPNLEVEFLHADGQDDMGFLEREFFMNEGPDNAPIFIQGYHSIYAAARRRNVRVLLNGAAGNHTISYAGNGLLAELARSGRWIETLRQARLNARAHCRSLFGELKTGLIAPLAPWWMRGLARRRPAADPWSEFSFLSRDALGAEKTIDRMRERKNVKLFALTLRERERRVARMLERNPGRGPGVLRDHLEFRSPARDRRIIEFCLALPQEAFCFDGVDRRLIRLGMAGRVPEAILRSQERGRQNMDWVPRAVRLRPELARVIEATEWDSPLAGLVDRDRLVRAFEAFDADEAAQSTKSWMLEIQGVHATIGTLHFLHWFEGRNFR